MELGVEETEMKTEELGSELEIDEEGTELE
jgi:hypothetical protein